MSWRTRWWQALANNSPAGRFHQIDGVVLTKFDTIDTKVMAPFCGSMSFGLGSLLSNNFLSLFSFFSGGVFLVFFFCFPWFFFFSWKRYANRSYLFSLKFPDLGLFPWFSCFPQQRIGISGISSSIRMAVARYTMWVLSCASTSKWGQDTRMTTLLWESPRYIRFRRRFP